MKKSTILPFFLICNFMILLSQKVLSADNVEHDYCDRIGDFCHHRTPGTACLRHNENLSKKDLSHFIRHHLGTDIYKLDMSSQEKVDSDILKELAANEKAGAIQFLDLMSTKASYSGIVALWNSPTFGSLVSTSPIYEQHTGAPISIIEIEIGHTRVYKQYKKKLFNYPLPLLQDFKITYGHRGVGNSWDTIGYKQIKLLDHGKELPKSKKKQN